MEKIENIKEISDVLPACIDEIALSQQQIKGSNIIPKLHSQIVLDNEISGINNEDDEHILHKIELLEKRVNNESQLNKRIKKLETRVTKLELKTYNFAEVIPVILIIAYILFMIFKKKC